MRSDFLKQRCSGLVTTEGVLNRHSRFDPGDTQDAYVDAMLLGTREHVDERMVGLEVVSSRDQIAHILAKRLQQP